MTFSNSYFSLSKKEKILRIGVVQSVYVFLFRTTAQFTHFLPRSMTVIIKGSISFWPSTDVTQISKMQCKRISRVLLMTLILIHCTVGWSTMMLKSSMLEVHEDIESLLEDTFDTLFKISTPLSLTKPLKTSGASEKFNRI